MDATWIIALVGPAILLIVLLWLVMKQRTKRDGAEER